MNDEAIFGPDEDYECACKKYSGQRFSNVICDTCGVRVGPRSLRRSRFGHINLSVPFGRDACGTKVDLFALPIVPASVRQSIGGTALDTSYERILDANDGRDAEGVRTAFRFVCSTILPALVTAIEWNLSDAETLAKGLALSLND